MTDIESGRRCFVISPIGRKGSVVGKHADAVFNDLILPAMKECGIEPTRSDQMDKPGRISDQMFRAILDYDLCVAVLTGHNPNVFYELAVAQAKGRPVVLLIEKSEPLPFDIKDLRCIMYDRDTRSRRNGAHIARLVKFVKDIEEANWKAPDIFAPFSDVGVAQAAVNSFCGRIMGPWWERITEDSGGYSLSYFEIKLEELHNSVLLEGRVYDTEGAVEAHWESAAAAIDTGGRKIVYVRKCWHPSRPSEEWYHGFGEMQFEASEAPMRGSGRFCDVGRTPRKTVVVRPVSLRRVSKENEKLTMRINIERDVRAVIVKVLRRF